MESNGEMDQNELLCKLASHLAQIYSKHISEYTPCLTKQKVKQIKTKPSQSLKPFERCEHKIVDQPMIQLFKDPDDILVAKTRITRKTNKTSTNLKRRPIKTNKVSNLYFDPEGDSLKKYKELYTYKNSPGVRTLTNIQEAVRIHNETLQKARAKKQYLDKIRKKREIRSLSEPHQILSSTNIDDGSSNKIIKIKPMQSKEPLETRRISSDDNNFSRKWQRFPSKDFLERNKLTKSKTEKSFNSCDGIMKSSSTTKLAMLPSQEFLNRNLPRKINEDAEFPQNSLSDFLLRVKTINPNHKKTLPAPVIKIGFQSDNTIHNSEPPHFFKSFTKEMNSSKYCGSPNQAKNKKNIIGGNETQDLTIAEGTLPTMTGLNENRRDVSPTNYEFQNEMCKTDMHSDYYWGEINEVSSSREMSNDRNQTNTKFSMVNVGFQRSSMKTNRESKRKESKLDQQFMALFESRIHLRSNESTEMKNDNKNLCRKQVSDDIIQKSRSYSRKPRNLEMKKSGSVPPLWECSLDRRDNIAQWKRMKESLEIVHKNRLKGQFTIQSFKEPFSNYEKMPLPDKFRLPLNK